MESLIKLTCYPEHSTAACVYNLVPSQLTGAVAGKPLCLVFLLTFPFKLGMLSWHVTAMGVTVLWLRRIGWILSVLVLDD